MDGETQLVISFRPSLCRPLTGLYAKPPPGSECSPAPSEGSSTATMTSPAADIASLFFKFRNCQPTTPKTLPSCFWSLSNAPSPRHPPNRTPLCSVYEGGAKQEPIRGEKSATKESLEWRMRKKKAKEGSWKKRFSPLSSRSFSIAKSEFFLSFLDKQAKREPLFNFFGAEPSPSMVFASVALCFTVLEHSSIVLSS